MSGSGGKSRDEGMMGLVQRALGSLSTRERSATPTPPPERGWEEAFTPPPGRTRTSRPPESANEAEEGASAPAPPPEPPDQEDSTATVVQRALTPDDLAAALAARERSSAREEGAAEGGDPDLPSAAGGGTPPPASESPAAGTLIAPMGAEALRRAALDEAERASIVLTWDESEPGSPKGDGGSLEDSELDRTAPRPVLAETPDPESIRAPTPRPALVGEAPPLLADSEDYDEETTLHGETLDGQATSPRLRVPDEAADLWPRGLDESAETGLWHAVAAADPMGALPTRPMPGHPGPAAVAFSQGAPYVVDDLAAAEALEDDDLRRTLPGTSRRDGAWHGEGGHRLAEYPNAAPERVLAEPVGFGDEYFERSPSGRLEHAALAGAPGGPAARGRTSPADGRRNSSGISAWEDQPTAVYEGRTRTPPPPSRGLSVRTTTPEALILHPSIASAEALAELLGGGFEGVRELPLSQLPETAPLPSVTAPDSLAAARYRMLGHQVEQAAAVDFCRVLAVTSASEADGKTVTALNLALILAEEPNRRVALIDCNLRRPGLSSVLGLGDELGLVGIYQRQLTLPQALLYIPERDLYLLPSGGPYPNPTEVLRSPLFLALLRRMEGEAGLLVIDTPSMLPSADVSLLSRLVDRLIIVVRAGRTRRAILAEALRGVDETKVLGVVLNEAGA